MMGESSSVDMRIVTASLKEIQQKVASYIPTDVYNMDKTKHFYEFAPYRTIAQFQLEDLKKSKKRFTYAFTTNIDGSHKLETFFIDHAKQSILFKKKIATQLGFMYRHNQKA